ncbi:STAS domain-containing protein [Paenibacillus physcomitrellae]|uniref:Anti-sigma factor antagonist n=1 Tax=Paenibacillus physcomitrellae TaxID=1619311 RepID=A0ABQ1FSV1_9BACL|nr:STAS domain-containing protein [Paenibacillus physcomitrellae]GGA29676.1 hypothetical protein GCM10010917_13390 [Paenibacillus physcomitrellae]
MFNYTLTQKDSLATVLLSGDMDIDVTEILQEDLAPKLRGAASIELDFSQVDFVDSSGIGLLITLIKDLKAQGIKVLIRNLSPEVEYVFSLLQLPLILGDDVFETPAKAGEQ